MWGLGRYHGQASGTPSKAAAEGCEVLRLSKAAAEVLKLLRPAQNVPHSTVSKPNRNSLWGLGRYHGQASGTPSKAAAEGCDVLRPSKAAAEVLRLYHGQARGTPSKAAAEGL